MEKAELKVITRNQDVRTESRRLRREGFVPANVYGYKTKNVVCAFEEKAIRKIFKTGFDTNMLLTLKSDSKEIDGKQVIVKGVERHPVKWSLTHADFFEVNNARPLTVKVPLKYVGVPAGVRLEGGIMQILRRTILVKALPQDVPQEITVDITELKLNHSLHIGEISVSDKLKVLEAKEYALVSVVEVKEEVAAAPVAAAEGAAAPAADGAAPAATDAKAPAK